MFFLKLSTSKMNPVVLSIYFVSSFCAHIETRDISVLVNTLQDPRPPAWSKAIYPPPPSSVKNNIKPSVKAISKKIAYRDLESQEDPYGLRPILKSVLSKDGKADTKYGDMNESGVDLNLKTLPNGDGLLKFNGLRGKGWTILEIKATIIKPLNGSEVVSIS